MRKDSLGLFWRDEPVIRVLKEPAPKRTPPRRTWEEPGYLPFLCEAKAKNFNLMTDAELVELGSRHVLGHPRERLVFDTEVYPNYTLIAFMSVRTKKIVYFEYDDTWEFNFDKQKLDYVLNHFCIIGYNSGNFDCPVVAMALKNQPCEHVKDFADSVILRNERPGDILRAYKVPKLEDQLALDHMDLMEVAPGVRISLKIYGGRLGSRRMQDLPFRPETVLNEDQMDIVRWYCMNDLEHTFLLYESLQDEIQLRERLSKENNVDLRSKSDAQIAETLLAMEISNINGRRCQRPRIATGTTYKFTPPPYLRFQTPAMQWVLNHVANTLFVVGEDGTIDVPPELKKMKIPLFGAEYTLQIGGLHSNEKNKAYKANHVYALYDIDVESFYPRMILNQGLYPLHLGPAFLKIFELYVNMRLDAKHAGRKKDADSLKIVINGTYGKLGSPYSILYAPDLLIQVTLSGQLSLLMLIEALEMAGIRVASANTDGIVTQCPHEKRETLKQIVAWWERECGFKTEETNYSAIYCANVNNYIAFKVNGDKPKTKGWFETMGIKKTPTAQISVDAICAFLATGKPIAETVQACTDVRKFVSVRKVAGGAVFGDEYLGGAVRWYYAKGEHPEMIYAKSGNKVALSDGAKPMMTLSESLPDDLDHDWYIKRSESLISELLI